MNQTNKDLHLFSWLSLWTNKKLHWFPIIPIIKLPVGLLDQSNASLAQVTNQMLPIGSSDQSNATLAEWPIIYFSGSSDQSNASLAQVTNQMLPYWLKGPIKCSPLAQVTNQMLLWLKWPIKMLLWLKWPIKMLRWLIWPIPSISLEVLRLSHTCWVRLVNSWNSETCEVSVLLPCT